MLGRHATTTCPDCGTGVPVARWCNWCGAALHVGTLQLPAGHRTWPAVAAALAVVGLLGIVTASGSSPGPGATTTVADTPVVLAEDAPPPPARPEATEPRTDVVCSDLRRHSVPTRLLDDTEPGSLSQLVWGPCIVMGPEGASLP